MPPIPELLHESHADNDSIEITCFSPFAIDAIIDEEVDNIPNEQLDELEDSVYSRWGVRVQLDVDPPGGYDTIMCAPMPAIIHDVLAAAVSTGLAAGAYNVLKAWVDSRNGRKLKIKVGDIEVEATQMKEDDVLRIFGLLEEKADRKKIRELLITANK